MPTVRFETLRDRATVPRARVYSKTRWDHAWVEETDWYPVQVEWRAAPGASMAVIERRYGHLIPPVGAVGWSESPLTVVARKPPTATTRLFIKIALETLSLTSDALGVHEMIWIGTCEVVADRIDGPIRRAVEPTPPSTDEITYTASGQQSFICYGLELLLDRIHVCTSRIKLGENEHTIDRGLTFNDRGVGNRSEARGTGGAFLFDGNPPGSAGYGERDWSTKQIVEYLLQIGTPRGVFEIEKIPFRLAEDVWTLSTADKPILPAHGHTLRSLLNSLLPRQRLLSYWIDVDELKTPHQVLVRPFTFTSEAITLIGEDVIFPNANQKELAFDRDRGAFASLRTTSLDSYEQVRVDGARRRSCFSVSFDDGTLERGWPTALETEYEQGASTAGDYPAAAEIEERQRRNAEARAAERLASVYARFALPASFDLKAGDGVGGTKNPITPDDADGAKVFTVNARELFVLPTIPLLDGHDYADGKIPDGVEELADGPFAELPPLVAWQIPEDPTRYALVEVAGSPAELDNAAEEANRRWSASVRVPERDRAFLIFVHGQPQHVIAFTDFAPLADDEELGENDFLQMIATIAIEDDRYCSFSHPETPEARDDLRVLRIQAGDEYRLDYVAPQTVVAIDPTDGSLIRSNGGFVRDDRDKLETIARLAWAWYGRQRHALQFDTSWPTRDLWLGDLITKIGDSELPGNATIDDVDSVVTAITVVMTKTQSHTPPPWRISYQTDFGELDPLRL